MTHVDARPATVWSPPPAVATRGTVVLFPGRGEHPGVYERFGRRIAADGYEVRAPEKDLTDFTDAARPFVLAGSDTGALRALAVAAENPVDGLLLAGVPVPSAQRVTLDWDAELDARTACPTHQARLTADPAFERGGLTEAVSAVPDGVEQITVPVLFLHGDADLVSPIAGARRLAGRLPHAEFATVHSGRHDVLNDASHRTVAAHVVQWLERLRSGTTILTVSAVEGP